MCPIWAATSAGSAGCDLKTAKAAVEKSHQSTGKGCCGQIYSNCRWTHALQNIWIVVDFILQFQCSHRYLSPRWRRGILVPSDTCWNGTTRLRTQRRTKVAGSRRFYRIFEGRLIADQLNLLNCVCSYSFLHLGNSSELRMRYLVITGLFWCVFFWFQAGEGVVIDQEQTQKYLVIRDVPWSHWDGWSLRCLRCLRCLRVCFGETMECLEYFDCWAIAI